ncbi:MAG: AAA family ATPase [Bacteroidetes bacterium]|nr:AAA family ATPase [Bacteroidota bacterium]
MLIRINQIQSIGCFQNSRAANLQFEQLTFIYGDNSSGKSTLCDIFQSLSENQVSYISKRRSIPNPNNDPQRVNFSFRLLNSTTETPIIFSNANWNPTIGDLKIYVFDTDFIHRNVFTGLTIERRNQENITQFVLGEDSVETARQIAENKSTLRSINRNIKSFEDNEFQDIASLQTFIEFEVNLEQQEIINNISNYERSIVQKRETLNNLDSLISKNEPVNLNNALDFSSFVERLNLCFEASYERVHENVTELILSHIRNNCNPESQSQSQTWIRQGLKQIISDNCPFCSQKLEADATNLISAYREHFDEAFREYENSINERLNNFTSESRSFIITNIPQPLITNAQLINEYKQLIDSTDVNDISDILNDLTEQLNTLIQTWNDGYVNVEEMISAKVQNKHLSITRDIGIIDLNDNIIQFNIILEVIGRYEESITTLIDLISNYKGSLNAETIREEIRNLENDILQQKLFLKRLQLEPSCRRYTELTRHKINNTRIIEELEERLETDQNTYLDNYFDRINELFTSLGSTNFTISRSINRRGNMPVFQLTAQYCGVNITNELISTFFSESDRRALVLSIFLAKILTLSTEQKNSSILVLDDPITSFDDNRIDRTIRLLETARPDFRQIIVLSHYPKYIKAFFERAHNNTNNVKLLKLIRDNTTSTFEEAFPIDFVETLHQKKYRKIIKYIERSHHEDISMDLRVFLEEEVKMRYRKQIEDNGLQNLLFSNLLDGLLENEIITEANRNGLEQFRLTLNVEHHTWCDHSQDEIIGIANDLVEYIYNEL